MSHRRPRRQLDYEAMAIATKLRFTDNPWLIGEAFTRRVLREFGVTEPNAHECRLYRRALRRLMNENTSR